MGPCVHQWACISELWNARYMLRDPCKLYTISVEDPEYSVFMQRMKLKIHTGTGAAPPWFLDNCTADIFPNINALLRANITLPLTSCTVERLFSSTSWIKTQLSVTLTTLCSNSRSPMSFEQKPSDSLDYSEIMDLFYSKHCHLCLG